MNEQKSVSPSVKQLAAQLHDGQIWSVAEQQAFAQFLVGYPNESSDGIISLGDAWKHGQAYGESMAIAAHQPLAASAVPAECLDDLAESFTHLIMDNSDVRQNKAVNLAQVMATFAKCHFAASPTPAATMPDGQAVSEPVAWWNTKYQSVMLMSRMSPQLGGMLGIQSSPAFKDGELVPLFLRDANWSNGWKSAIAWLRNNYQDYVNFADLCDAMADAAPAQQPASSEASE